MKTYRVVFDAAAQKDLFDFFDALMAEAGPATAERIIGQVVTYCRSFATFPERGARHDELRPGLRTVGWRRRATIAFRVREDTVTIIRILFRGRALTLPEEEVG